MATLEWKGLDVVFANLNKEIQKLEKNTLDGLLEAALLVKAESQRDTPVDTGNLKSGAYVIWGGGRKRIKSESDPQEFRTGKGRPESVSKEIGEHHDTVRGRESANARVGSTLDFVAPFAEIGFTASYALEVHEGLNKKFRTGHAKFLERALLDNQNRILEIIVRRAKIR